MQHGDLSNQVAPRLVFVFESTIGYLDGPAAQAKHTFFLRTHRWKQAAGVWSFDSLTNKWFWDLAYRRNFTCDIVTFLDHREAEHIEARLDRQGYPFGNFWIMGQAEFLKDLLPNPAVKAVFDWDARRLFTYGAKGRREMVL